MDNDRPRFSPDKFKELMLHAAHESVGDAHFGAVKLNKILFFCDFLAFGLMGEAITGATYIKQQRGPVPREIRYMAGQLENDGYARFVSEPIFNYTLKRLVAYRPANVSIFSAEHLDLINDVIKNLAQHTAAETSDLSHDRSFAWEIAEIGQEIPYSAVFLSRRSATAVDIDRGKKLAKEHGWLQTVR